MKKKFLLISFLILAMLCVQAVNVRDFGAVGNGVQDDTAAIQKALDQLGDIYFPAGNYLVRSNQLEIKSGSRLFGDGESSRIFTKDQSDVEYNLLKAVSQRNITVEKLTFQAPIAYSAALLFASCRDITVRDCVANVCPLVYVGTDRVSVYGDINSPNAFFHIYDAVKEDSHYSHNISIENNRCTGPLNMASKGRLRGLSAIMLCFVKNARVGSNYITGYQHGIMFWGGNANTQDGTPNGFPSNPRKCINISITGNTIFDIQLGGIWGAMGEVVAITGNTVYDCNDVGIDFEACWNSTAAGNAVRDCFAACLATCFDNRNVVFSGNSCAQQANGAWIVMVQNLHGSQALTSPNNESVSFVGNTFISEKGLAHVVSQGVNQLVFSDNILRNVIITANSAKQTHRDISFVGNQMLFSGDIAVNTTAVNFGNIAKNGNVMISSNIISNPDEIRFSSPAVSVGNSAGSWMIANNSIPAWNGRPLFLAEKTPKTVVGANILDATP